MAQFTRKFLDVVTIKTFKQFNFQPSLALLKDVVIRSFCVHIGLLDHLRLDNIFLFNNTNRFHSLQENQIHIYKEATSTGYERQQ